MSRDDARNPYSDEFATLGDRLAAARDAQGLSHQDVARRLGVNARTILAWEDDRSEPRSSRMQMLCGILNVSLIWLMTGEGDGVDIVFDADSDADHVEAAQHVLADVRALMAEQRQLADRLARIEKRLRAMLLD